MNAGRGAGSAAHWVQLSSDHYINLGLAETIAEVERYDAAGDLVKGLEVRWAGGGDPLQVFGAERAALQAHLGRLYG